MVVLGCVTMVNVEKVIAVTEEPVTQNTLLYADFDYLQITTIVDTFISNGLFLNN